MHRAHRRARSRWIAAVAVVAPFLLHVVACSDGPRGRDMGEAGGMMRMMGDRGMEMPDGIPASDLPDPESRGAELAAAFCGQCHGLPSPRRHTAEDWEATARRMFRRMGHMGRMGGGMMMDVEAPTADEERAIVAYLRRHAMRGAREEALPEARGREAFVRTCSRCHGLPDPRQREADEWPAVVERMRGHMERMGVEGISDDEAERVIRYLRAAADRRR